MLFEFAEFEPREAIIKQYMFKLLGEECGCGVECFMDVPTLAVRV
jgi:hypothetical protein